MTTIKLGDKVRDTISGFTGTVVARHEYLNGCVRVSIQPNELHEGKPIDSFTFDIEQIEVIQADQHKQLERTGGPEVTPRRAAVPKR